MAALPANAKEQLGRVAIEQRPAPKPVLRVVEPKPEVPAADPTPEDAYFDARLIIEEIFPSFDCEFPDELPEDVTLDHLGKWFEHHVINRFGAEGLDCVGDDSSLLIWPNRHCGPLIEYNVASDEWCDGSLDRRDKGVESLLGHISIARHPERIMLRIEFTAEPRPEPAREALETCRLLRVDGALAEFVAWASRTAYRDQPFLALGAAICMIGALAGRRYAGTTNVRTNIYAAGIAGSAGGKEHSRNCIKNALATAGLDNRFLGPEDTTSDTAIVRALRSYPSRVYTFDEYGKMLQAMASDGAASHLAAITPVLMKLFSAAGSSYKTKEYADPKANPSFILRNPNVCVWATGVPHDFYAATNSRAMKDGSLARWLIFRAPDDVPQRQRGDHHEPPPETLLGAMRAIAAGVDGHDYGGNVADLGHGEVAMAPYVVPETPEARAVFEAKEDRADAWQREATDTDAAFVGRLVEHARKLALIRAISRDPGMPEVTEADAAWGWDLAVHCTTTVMRDVERFVADSKAEADWKLIRNAIIDAGGEISASDLTRAVRKIAPRDRGAVIRDMADAGEIIEEIRAGKTRPIKVYRMPTTH